MADLLDELSAHGFEIVKDESGQVLVKLVFMDENDEATGYALVAPEDAKKILSGEAALQNVVDDEGKQVLTLAPVVPEDQDDLNQHPEDDATTCASSVSVADVAEPPKATSVPDESNSGNEVDVSPAVQPMKADEKTTGIVTNSTSEDGNAGVESAPVENESLQTIPENVEQFVLSEQTAMVNNKPIQVVTLMDSQGQVLDQKQGETGEQVVLEIFRQMFSYELQGPSDTGEPITSTLLVSAGNADDTDTAVPEERTSEVPRTATAPNWTDDTSASRGYDQSEVTPAGQQFTLTEAMALVNGDPMQTVILTDENGNVLDQKQGHTGEHVIIEMSGNSLEYVFLGPTESGEPITTTLVVTTDPEAADVAQADAVESDQHECSEAVGTAADWCPSGLPPEFYSVLCRQAEAIVALRIPQSADGTPTYRPEPYHRKLGPLATYQSMVEVVNSYLLGASRGETLAGYEVLRNYAKIYRPSGPHSRALTKYELALNEAAAQICRYHPGLLFHKRELFHLAKETVEQSQNTLNTERRVQQQQQQQHQQHDLTSHLRSSDLASHLTQGKGTQPQSMVQRTPTTRSIPQTTAVSGRVASSQLALLESRGLSGIKQTSQPQSQSQQQLSVGPGGTAAVPAAYSSTASTASVTSLHSDQSVLINEQPTTTGPITQALTANKSRTVLSETSAPYYAGLSAMKRDAMNKLTIQQEESLKTAALDLLYELPHYDLKPKVDCTNIELACWEQARQLSSETLSLDTAALDSAHASHASFNALLCNEARLNGVRESAALYGRQAGFMQPPNGTGVGIARSPTVPVLIPYEVACNEAAAYLAAAMPNLLTHRRDLAELAKKVVRNSGCLFTTTAADKIAATGGGYRFYCTDQLPELDLSAADHLLTDPLDRSDSPDSGCCVSPTETETDGVTVNFQTLALSCEECNNVVDDVTIYTTTGTDSLKKVRILNLSDCGFTGLIPMYVNQCSNLIELNLSGNALYGFPRCLHLPKLKRLNLRGNPRLLRPNPSTGTVEPPLVEQFPRLVSLELDPKLAELLCRQSLAYLCPYLKLINGEDFTEEPSDETMKIIQATKHQISGLIYSKWEDDIAGFYKKGLPKRDAIRVIETLVLHSVKRTDDLARQFSHCTSILARRVAEDFLAPKLLDDEYEDETAEKVLPAEEITDEEDEAESDEEEVDDTSSSKPGEIATDGAETSAIGKSNTTSRPKLKRICPTQTSVAEREAEAAAANLTLLPDESPDRLVNVVGQALRHGKTVVYAVIRTASRQPNGELIPVGGGLGITSSSVNSNSNGSSMLASHATEETNRSEPEGDSEAAEPTIIPPVESAKEPASRPLIQKTHTKSQRPSSQTGRTQTQRGHTASHQKGNKSQQPRPQARSSVATPKAAASHEKTPRPTPSSKTDTPVGGAVLGTRRPGLLVTRTSASSGQPASVVITQQPSTGTSGTTTSPTTAGSGVIMLHQRRVNPSNYIIRPSTSESEPALVVPSNLVRDNAGSLWTPGKRGRPSVAMSMAKRTTETIADAAETSKLVENVPIPPPHAPPPPTMRMTTRDSNRLKRFSAYGVIDTAAALEGKEDALIAAALAVQDNHETAEAKLVLQNSSVILTEADTALAEAAFANSTYDQETSDSSPKPSKSKSKSKDTPTPTEGATKRRRRAATPQVEEELPDSEELPGSPVIATATPIAPAGRKRPSKPQSPKPNELKRMSVEPPTPMLSSLNQQASRSTPKPGARSLSELGSVVDYDPLHFIRCHARDNDPLDCETKVWRCAFEPSVNDPHNETSTVVATCGGECVCLIDCRSGRVMKRFKHFGEEFYTLAWTTVEMSTGHKTNLLAAAGKLREIRLLHPEQLVCYAEMRGHKDDIACMIFHPTKPTVLFSGDSKACILVWDIGIPSAPEYRTRHQLLMRLVCPRANLNPVLNLVFLPKFDALVAGCEDGVFSWTLPDFRKEKLNEERTADLELKIPTRCEPCFDGLAKLTEQLIVVKCVEEGEIYVFDFAQVLQRAKRLTSGKKHVTVELRGQLRWQTTDEIYINVTARPGLNAVVCGDNEGTIWLYDLQKQVTEDSRRFKSKPVKILEWPECSVGGTKDEDSQLKENITSGFKNPVVNTTDISHDGQYLVAVTDNNLVCIWKFSG
ncbi:Leucine-rich repeat and WD repeat-containing protein 1 [Fasciola hepatica]|uniref:Leucine-rich repeat and WD repeat-containing protein 1 n=1 Tax=Fasciola hepatica TaxID=6192 RepID=A0A4E0RDR1_FASHE|nr:Leucine-rich repeat and WD repeat-containing protein 1 [Fasciola hepatica]